MTASGRQPPLASRSFLAHPLVSDFCAEQAQGAERHECRTEATKLPLPQTGEGSYSARLFPLAPSQPR